MKAVVDASVAAKWVIEEDRSDKAVLLLEYEQLHAPDHWLAEAVNVVWSKVYKGDLDASDAEERMAVLSRSPVIVTAISTLMPAAFAISVDHSITVYDALYVALACKRRMPFITDDQNLIRRLSGTQLSSHVIPLSVLTRAHFENDDCVRSQSGNVSDGRRLRFEMRDHGSQTEFGLATSFVPN